MPERNITRNQEVSAVRVECFRELRNEMTDADKEFREMVRNRGMFGLKFRRQQIIDGFIVDFIVTVSACA